MNALQLPAAPVGVSVPLNTASLLYRLCSGAAHVRIYLFFSFLFSFSRASMLRRILEVWVALVVFVCFV